MPWMSSESDLENSLISWQVKAKANKSIYLINTKQKTPFSKHKATNVQKLME